MGIKNKYPLLTFLRLFSLSQFHELPSLDLLNETKIELAFRKTECSTLHLELNYEYWIVTANLAG